MNPDNCYDLRRLKPTGMELYIERITAANSNMHRNKREVRLVLERERRWCEVQGHRKQTTRGRHTYYLTISFLSLQEIQRLESFTVMKEKHLNVSSQKCV